MHGDPDVVSWLSARSTVSWVEEFEDKIEDETHDYVEFGDDAVLESEIEAIVAAQEPLEESDANEVLATWKQTRTAMA